MNKYKVFTKLEEVIQRHRAEDRERYGIDDDKYQIHMGINLFYELRGEHPNWIFERGKEFEKFLNCIIMVSPFETDNIITLTRGKNLLLEEINADDI